MGTINNYLYKNRFITPYDEKGTLEVYMEGNKIEKEMFQVKSKKNTITGINIYAGLLDQKSFNNLIELIRVTTDKPVFISFIPNLEGLEKYNGSIKDYDEYINNYLDDAEELEEAYARYIANYRNHELINDPENGKLRHFPDNILINQTFIDTDTEKANLVNKKDLQM